MTTFLFWNLNRKPLQGLIRRLADERNIDVLALAECGMRPEDVLLEVNRGEDNDYHYIAAGQGNEIQLFTRFPRDMSSPISLTDTQPPPDRRRLKCYEIQLPGVESFLLVVVHLRSKLYNSETEQLGDAGKLSAQIRAIENQLGHSRTVLVGDLNMNPFERGVISGMGLHAVSSRAVAQRRTRRVGGAELPFFYNPMWNLLGDTTPGPPGTFYYSDSRYDAYFWHMLDQVLVRPDILTRLHNHSVEIISDIGQESLLSANGLPNDNIASDYLPILFKLDFSVST